MTQFLFPADRRKAADSLKALLNGNTSVVEAMDACGASNSNAPTNFTWNSVFGSVVGFLRAEVESIAKSADKVRMGMDTVEMGKREGGISIPL